jgi:hypothetical protein
MGADRIFPGGGWWQPENLLTHLRLNLLRVFLPIVIEYKDRRFFKIYFYLLLVFGIFFISLISIVSQKSKAGGGG